MVSIIKLARNSITHPLVFNRNSGKTSISSLQKSVHECLKLLLTTTRGELLGDPDFGTNIVSFIFDNNSIMRDSLIRDDIIYAVNKYERRVKMTKDDITIQSDELYTKITIKYKLILTGESCDFKLSILNN